MPTWLPAALTLLLFVAAGTLFYRDATTQPAAPRATDEAREKRPQAEREVEIPTEDPSADTDGDDARTTGAEDDEEDEQAEPPPEARSLRGMTIAIDPAGGTRREGGAAEGPRVAVGGISPSCLGRSKGGAAEGAATLAAARELREILVAAGAKVELTRDADDGSAPCTGARVAQLERADIGIVLGADSGHGWRVLPARPAVRSEQTPPPVELAAARELARDVDGALDAALPEVAGPDATEPRTPAMSRADVVRRGELGAIDLAGGAPVVFIDMGDLDVAVDAERLEDPKGRAPFLRAIVVGLGTWAVRSS